MSQGPDKETQTRFLCAGKLRASWGKTGGGGGEGLCELI